MRHRLAQIAILTTACLLAGQPLVEGQDGVSEIQAETSCALAAASDDSQPSDPKIFIAEVTFSSVLQLPLTDQDRIAASIKQRTCGSSREAVTDEALARVRDEWQDRGYFRVQVSGEARTLTKSPASQRIAISVHVDEGMQYRLGEIRFKHNNAIRDITALRGLFPIKDGNIFRPHKIATGLENLRKAYGEFGYIDVTLVPDTKLDDENKLISLEIDIDEGGRFYFSTVTVLGLDKRALEEVVKDFPTGQVYNGRLLNLFLVKHGSRFKFPPDDPRHIGILRDEQAGTVAITIDTRPSPVD